jgi:hypothetical protein
MHNTVNLSTHITRTLTHYQPHTHTQLHITKQVRTTTVQVTGFGNILAPARVYVHYLKRKWTCVRNIL